MTKSALMLAILICASAGAATAQGFTPDPRVDAVFADLDRADAPGCALGVYRDAKMLYARGYGLADLERQVPITPASVFDLGSTSKQFAAATIVLLAQEGKLSLDDDVRRFIPELPGYERPITIRHLLHHTSGLRDYLGLLRLAGFRYDDVTTPEDALGAISRQRALNFPPGDEHLYSNSGYFLLSIIVERVTDRSLRDEARDRIFAPLGMTHTEYLGSYNDIIRHRAIGYAPTDDGFEADMPRWLQLGDGAVFSTVEDLLKWEENFRSLRVGGSAMRDTMLTRGRLTNGDTITYALGLMHGKHRGLATVHHGGSWGGYRAELLRFPGQQYGVAVLCNRGDADPSSLALRVAEVHLAAEMTAPPTVLAGAKHDGGPPKPRAPITTRPLESYVGTYRVPQTANIVTVAVVNGELTVTEPRTNTLRPLSADEFEIVGVPGGARLVFAAGATTNSPARRISTWVAGEQLQSYERFEVPTDLSGGLDAFVGSYHSAELDAPLEVTRAGDVLRLALRNAPSRPMRRLARDEFISGGLLLKFTQDATGRVTGGSLSQGRVRNIQFER